MADSLYRVSVFTAFTANHWMPLWMLLVVVGRDVIVSATPAWLPTTSAP